MTIMIGSARIDENGNASGGSVGDQKQASTPDYKGEVSQQEFYVHSKGWYILRPKSAEVAEKIAQAMIKYCNDKGVGYDQGNRLGIMSYNGEGNTECDCSSLTRRCIKDASGKDVGNYTTGNEATVLEKSGLFEGKVKYVNSTSTPLYTGDILVTCSKGHTVAVTKGNSRSTTSSSSNSSKSSSTSYTSIVDALASKGIDSSYTNRAKIAALNGIANYSGTAEQNSKLLKLFNSGSLNTNVTTSSSSSVQYYKACDSKYTSIADALTSIGVDGSFTNRKKIASVNGYKAYTGSSAQNSALLKLLKQGKLIKY